MPKVTLTCRECGKQYIACKTPNWGVWRWQDVACSQECARAYLAKAAANQTAQSKDKPSE